MSRFPIFALVVALAAMPGRAMFEEDGASVRAEGIAGAFTAVADDASAAGYNPAGLCQVQGSQFHGFYKLLYRGVGVNLHSGHAGFAMPVGRTGTFCPAVQETGFRQSGEGRIAASPVREPMEVGLDSRHETVQVSRVRVACDPGKRFGSRVQSIVVNGEPLDPGRCYRVVTNSYLGSGTGEYGVPGRGER